MMEIAKSGDFTHSHRTTTARSYTDISIGRITLSFLLSANKILLNMLIKLINLMF